MNGGVFGVFVVVSSASSLSAHRVRRLPQVVGAMVSVPAGRSSNILGSATTRRSSRPGESSSSHDEEDRARFTDKLFFSLLWGVQEMSRC